MFTTAVPTVIVVTLLSNQSQAVQSILNIGNAISIEYYDKNKMFLLF